MDKAKVTGSRCECELDCDRSDELRVEVSLVTVKHIANCKTSCLLL